MKPGLSRNRSSMKIFLLGKTGLLGKAIFSVFKNEYEVFAPGSDECDITDQHSLRRSIKSVKPDFVINASGYAQVDRAEEDSMKAFELNSLAVASLASIAGEKNIPLLHFSTDYVFDGKKSTGYRENDKPSPLSVYGRSKLEGEIAVMQNLKKYYLIRTAWLFGPGGKNFVDTMLFLAQEEPGIRVVNDKIGCPTFTFDLAQALLGLLKGKPYGIYHIVNDGIATWYELAQEIFYQLGVPKKIVPILTSEFNRPAERPANSVLLNTKFPKLRHWKEALADYLQDKQFIL